MHDTMRRWEHSMISLLLLTLVLVSERGTSFSSALSPYTSPTRTIGRIQEIVSREQPIPSVSSLFSSTSNDNQASSSSPSSASSTGSDDRRNESLEQGHHPLWSLNLNLDSLAKQGAGSRAQELLRRIHALYKEGYYEVSPDIVSYNSVLKAWKEDEQPEAALELLETMIRNEREAELSDQPFESSGNTKTNNIRVDTISFNTVIAAFANQGDHHKALELLRKMQKKKQQNPLHASGFEDDTDDFYYPDPDTITYNIVLYGLAQSNDLGTAAEAENLLREMMLRKERTGVSLVDTTSFNTVLYAWSREGEKSKAPPPSAGASTIGRPDQKPRTMLPKRPVSVSMAAQRAESMLTIMEELHEAGNGRVRPDVYSYTTTIQCWAKVGDPAGGATNTDKAQAVLNRMIDKGLQPNKLTYTALINAFSKAGKPERAEYVLHQMTQANHKPDTVAFSAIIDGWAKVSGKDRPEAAARSLQILETMRGNEARGMGPTATTYTSVLNALAKSGARDASDQALELLREMEEEYAETGDGPAGDRDGPPPSSREPAQVDTRSDKWSLRPTNIHYNCVLNAYARSSRADKAVKAQQLMTVMERHSRLDCRPDTISYNSLMMACAHATGNRMIKDQSFEIAIRTFKILVSGDGEDARKSLGPTSTTFAHFFRSCRKLLHPNHVRRGSILTKGLAMCRKLGMLNFLVVHQVQLACQSDAAWETIAGELSEYVGWKEDFRRCGKSVPREWTCKARR